MPRRPLLFRAALVAACSVVLPLSLSAQSSRVSLDLALGGGSGLGGRYDNRGSASADALLGVRIEERGRGRVIVGATLGVQGPIGQSDVCLAHPDAVCLDDFPSLFTAGAVVGWEQGRLGGASVRALVGPASYWGHDGSSIGLQSRLDAATPAFARVAFVASARGSLVPRLAGDTLGFWSLNLGFRIQ